MPSRQFSNKQKILFHKVMDGKVWADAWTHPNVEGAMDDECDGW